MGWYIWVLIGVMTACTLLLGVTFIWASVTLMRVARGDFGDLNGSDHDAVRSEP